MQESAITFQPVHKLRELVARRSPFQTAFTDSLPVALLYGQRDLLTPPEVAHWLADTLPDARLTVFPTASHAPFLSHEADFLATLRPFLHECA